MSPFRYRFPLVLFSLVSITASGREEHGDTRLVWHNNVTNSDRAADRVAALQWRSEFATSSSWLLPASNIVRADWKVRTDLWPRYQGLDAIRTGPEINWSHKIGLGSQVPVLSARGEGTGVLARESPRSGYGGRLTAQVQRRLGFDWQLVAGVEWEKYWARGPAFNLSGREYFLTVEYQVSKDWRLNAEVRSRHGTVVSYTTPPRPDLVKAGKVLTLLDTFERASPLLAYYFPAETISGAVELTRVLDRRSALFLQLEYRDTTHNALRYLNTRTTVGFARRL